MNLYRHAVPPAGMPPFDQQFEFNSSTIHSFSLHILPASSAGSDHYLWNVVILDLWSTEPAAARFHQCIITNWCLFWQTLLIAFTSPLSVEDYGENVFASSHL